MAVDGLLRGAGDMKMFTVANFVNLFIRVFVAMGICTDFRLANGMDCSSYRLVFKLDYIVFGVSDRQVEKDI